MPFDLCRSLLALAALIENLDPRYRLMLVALAAFSTIWITALGAAIGSFLNVVIYRLPQGMSLLRPKSRCPACGTPIRPGDNVPVFGWLRLRGRCRSCGNRISSRYPLVEATTAALFLGLAHFELFSGGSNLPGGPEGGNPLGFILWNLKPELVGLFAYHAMLLCVLLCLSLIAWDGFPPPRRLLAVALAIGLLAPALLPPLHPVAAGLPLDRLPTWSLPLGQRSLEIDPAAFFETLVGLFTGAGVGLLLAGAVPASRASAADRRGTIAAAAMIGTFLGGPAAIACGLLAALLALASAAASHVLTRSPLLTAVVAVTTLVQIPLWRTLLRWDCWPGPAGWNVLRSVGLPQQGFTVTSLTAAVVATGLIAMIAGRIARRPPQ